MYTGIVQGIFPVVSLEDHGDFRRFAIQYDTNFVADVQLGASVAVNGVCCTVSQIEGQTLWYDAMQETLNRTTLGQLQIGDQVNSERSAILGQENGGHEISGHVDGCLIIRQIKQTERNYVLTLEVPVSHRDYVFNKGFLGIHGCSLTVSNWAHETGLFEVWLIPETLRLTNLGQYQVGEQLNFEVERKTQVLVESVQRYLGSESGQALIRQLLPK